jgi:trigger factor
VPGFRPGKTPIGVVKSRFREEILDALMNRLVPHSFLHAVQERRLAVVEGSEQFDGSGYTPGEPMKFRVTFETYPELNIANYTGIPVEEVTVNVEDSEVEAQLKKIQNDNAELIPIEVDRLIHEGDFVEVSFHGNVEGTAGNNVQIEVGGSTTLPEFTSNLLGKRVNDLVTFSVQYRDDYPAERLAGRSVEYTLKVEGVKEKKLPDLTDEFAERLGEFKSMEDLKERLRRDMEAHKQERAKEERRQKLLNWLEERNTFEVPETLVNRQTQLRMRRMARELERQGVDPRRLDVDWMKLREEQHRQSVRDVKGTLILDFIANAEGLSASDEDVEREVERISRESDRPLEKVREVLSHDSGLDRLKFEIRRARTLTFLDERASATKGTP